MFKLYEDRITVAHSIDKSDANKKSIEPGTLLVMGAGGLRKITATDTITMKNIGSFYISNDYYQNSGMAVIHGYENATSGKIAAMSIMDRANMSMTLNMLLHKGDLLTVVDGEIVKTVPGILKEHVVFATVLEDNHDSSDNIYESTLISTLSGKPVETENKQPILQLVGEPILENMSDPSISFALADALFNEEECIKTENWEFEIGTTKLLLDQVTISKEGDIATVSFTGMSEPGNMSFKLKKAAIKDLYTSKESELDSSIYELAVESTTPYLVIRGSDMVKGATGGTIDVSVANAAFFDDASGAKDVNNWVIVQADNLALDSIELSDGIATLTLSAIEGEMIRKDDIVVNASGPAFIGTERDAVAATLKIENRPAVLTPDIKSIVEGTSGATVKLTLENSMFDAVSSEDEENWTIGGDSGLSLSAAHYDSATAVTLEFIGTVGPARTQLAIIAGDVFIEENANSNAVDIPVVESE